MIEQEYAPKAGNRECRLFFGTLSIRDESKGKMRIFTTSVTRTNLFTMVEWHKVFRRFEGVASIYDTISSG